MRRRMRRGLFATVAALLLSGAAGCASDSWSAAADVNPSEWAAGAEILFPNADSLARYDATLFLRCNDRFAEDTLTVRIAVTTPDSLRSEGSSSCWPSPAPRARQPSSVRLPCPTAAQSASGGRATTGSPSRRPVRYAGSRP